MAQRAQRLIDAAKNSPLPEGTYAVGAGLLVAGLTAYGFQILTFRELTESQYAALNGLWILIFIVTPGLFQPIEQEVSRALASRRSQGLGGAPLVKRASFLGAIFAAVAIVITLIVSPKLISNLFHDDSALLIGLLISIVAYYVMFLTRGTLSGNGRFGSYGLLNGAEGAVRMLFVVALVILGASTPGPYGIALAVPPLIAVGIALSRERNLMQPGPPAPYSELSNALGWLLAASIIAQALSYSPALAAQLLADGDAQHDLAGKFIAGFYIARIPILLFQAVQAALLPKLAGLAGSGQHDDFRSGLRRLVVIVLCLAAVGTIGGFTLGGFAGEILFGDKFVLSNRDLGLLALGSGMFILALTLAQGMIALRAYRGTVAAWALGLLTMLGVTASLNDLFLRSEMGFVTGSAVAAGVMGVLLVARMRKGLPEATVDDLVEVIEHETLEI